MGVIEIRMAEIWYQILAELHVAGSPNLRRVTQLSVDAHPAGYGCRGSGATKDTYQISAMHLGRTVKVVR